jgi:hypothetical protein
MNPGDIYLGLLGQEIKLTDAERLVTPQPQEEVNSKRSASKKLLEDIIRRYINYQIDYASMRGPDHDTIENLYNLQQHLNLIVVDRLGNQTSQMVKMKFTPGKRESIAGNWLWSGVSIALEVI